MNLLLKNVRIVDGQGGEPLDRGAILIEGSRLAFVGPDADGPRDIGNRAVLDVHGRTVLPGLINSRTHVTMDEQDAARPVRVYPDGELVGFFRRPPGRDARWTTALPRCATGGHMYIMSFEADGVDSIRRGVREQVKAGADFIKLVAEASSLEKVSLVSFAGPFGGVETCPKHCYGIISARR